MPILYTDPLFLEHETGLGHPECPQRLASIFRMFERTGLADRYSRGTITPATLEQLELVHAPSYVNDVARFAATGGGHIESDTVCSSRSFDAACLAAGAAISAVDEVIAGDHRQAAVVARPPGHHALPDQAMGFCLFANAAIAARHAQEKYGLSRVLIVDWDVHHGNGTQDIFYTDPSIGFFSAHRYPFYPGSGAADETGAGPAVGTKFNLPLSYGVSRHEYRERFATMLANAATRTLPELIILSAGFDAHAADPIGSLGLESEDFADLTRLVCDVASHYCEGRLISLLEGGYNLDALAESVECHLETLLE